MASYDILETNVTAVTTDTAANQKNAIMQQTNMEWLPCICHVLELVMGVLMTRFKEVKDGRNFQVSPEQLYGACLHGSHTYFLIND